MLINTDLQKNFATLSAGDIVVSLTETDTQIHLGSDAYEVVGQTVRLTQAGVDFVHNNGHLPTLSVQSSGGQTEYLVTRAFDMAEDVNIKPAADPAVKDFTTLQVRSTDASVSNHSIALLKTSLSGVAEFAPDVLTASLNLWTTSGSKTATTGGLDLFRLADASWTEDDIASSPYTAAAPGSGGTLDAAFSAAYGGAASFAAGQGFDVADSAVLFDLTTAGLTDGEVAFALLSDGGSADNYWLHSSEAASDGLRPNLTVAYATDTPVRARDDALTVSEGGSSIGNGLELFANDIALLETAERTVVSVNGIAWADLALSQHDIFSEAGAYRAIEGSHGTLYLQHSGRAFYEHNGANLDADVQDVFSYTFSDTLLTSTSGDLVVDVEARNQTPDLSLTPRNLLVSNAAAVEGDVVATFVASDPDGDMLSIGWTNDVTPANAQGVALYEINAAERSVVLTEAGAAHANAGHDLPKISLTLVDSAAQTGTTTVSATPHAATGNVWFVDQAHGSDTNSGAGLETAFASIEAANAVVAAGDTVFLVGTYQRADYIPDFTINSAADIMDPYVWNGQGTFRLRDIHGTEDAPITYRGWDENSKILAMGNAGFQIDDSSHIRVENLEVVGLVDSLIDVAEQLQFVYRLDATETGYDQAQYRYLTDKDGTTHDLLIGSDASYDYFYRVPPDSTAAYVEEHFSEPGSLEFLPSSDQRPALANSAGILSRDSFYIDITETYVHHIPGTGIRVQRGEYVNVFGNEVHDTSRSSSLGTQAVVVQDAGHDIAVLPDQSNLYKITFVDNEVYNNFNGIYSWVGVKDFITPHLDEGNGISPQWQTSAAWNADGATGRILIADNITYLNGMAGINNHAGDRVVVANNSSWMNASYGHLLNVSDKGTQGGIVSAADVKGGVEFGDDIWFYNNLSIANGLHNDGNHFAIRVNPNSPRVNDPGGRISGQITFDGAANVGLDVADGSIRFQDEELAYPGFIFDASGISAASLFVDPGTFDFRAAPSSALATAGSTLVSGLNLPDFVYDDIYDGGAGFDQIGASAFVDMPTQLVSLGESGQVLEGDSDKNYLVGDARNDVILGGAGKDWLRGGAGSDTLNGGDGFDWLIYKGSQAGVTIDLNADSSTGLQSASGGDATGDTISAFEAVSGSNHADTLVGNDANNQLVGAAGDDIIDGGAGKDWLRGGKGADTMDGGAGFDWLHYKGSGAGVTIDLTADPDTGLQSASGGDASGDTIRNFEAVRGSRHADMLTGDANKNFLVGAAGDDTLSGGAGKDWLRGGKGADTMDGGAGHDWLIYKGSSAGVTVDLTADPDTGLQSASGGDASGDSIRAFEAVRGSSHADTLIGNDLNNSLAGAGGDDTLKGGGGKDWLRGGGGADVFVLERNGGPDTVLDFQNGQDRIAFETTQALAYADLTISADAADAIVTYDGGELRVVDMAGQIDQSDFLFDFMM